MNALFFWSEDSGKTFQNHQHISISKEWGYGVRFRDERNGAIQILGGPFFYTSNGGRNASDWKLVNSLSRQSLDFQFMYRSSGLFSATGSAFCYGFFPGSLKCNANIPMRNLNAGSWWHPNTGFAIMGGGEISPSVCGFVHVSMDNGASWNRTLSTNFPVRGVWMSDNLQVGIVYGGDVYSNLGGIYSTQNNNATNWNLDLQTTTENWGMDVIQISARTSQIFIVGTTSSPTWTSYFYTSLINF